MDLGDADTFRWTPAGTSDFVIASGNKTLKVQCTMAFDEPEGARYRAGHLHRKEQEFGEENGFYFGGGGIFEPIVRDVAKQLSTWRAGIATAVRSKLRKVSYNAQELDLLVFARSCSFELIDYDFAEVVVPALDHVGKENWGSVFSNIYVGTTGRSCTSRSMILVHVLCPFSETVSHVSAHHPDPPLRRRPKAGPKEPDGSRQSDAREATTPKYHREMC